MKRALSALLAAPLLLAACSSEPEARSYSDVNEMLASVDKQDSAVQCQKVEQRDRPLITQATHQGNCVDQNGADANLLIFDTQADIDSRVGEAMQRDIWASGEWIILRGPNWTVDCKSLGQCENWQDALGGEILGMNVDK